MTAAAAPSLDPHLASSSSNQQLGLALMYACLPCNLWEDRWVLPL